MCLSGSLLVPGPRNRQTSLVLAGILGGGGEAKCFFRPTFPPSKVPVFFQARKKSTKINLLGPETAHLGGVFFRAKGWWPKSSCPPSRACLPWVSKRGIRDVPGILPGFPRPLWMFKFVRILGYPSLPSQGIKNSSQYRERNSPRRQRNITERAQKYSFS